MTIITAQRPTTRGARQHSHVVADSITMLRRNLLHMVRYPGLSVFTIVGPVVMTQLFGHFSAADAHPYVPGAAFFFAGLLAIACFAVFWTSTSGPEPVEKPVRVETAPA